MENEKKQIAILGSTGSIGTQALDVIREHKDLFEAYALTANNNVELLIRQAREFLPDVVVIANERKYKQLKEALSDLPIKVWAGAEAICQVVQEKRIEIVLTAMVGYSGLKPTISAIQAGKGIALANKETLVVAGELIIPLTIKCGAHIIPVDSEHSAIFQCLVGDVDNPIEKIILTASGGPFRTFSQEQLATVTKKEALRHPNWNMGAKVTIDSATLMNKGFEMIEAKWLFDVDIANIQILVHPQSIIHSMVQFEDSSIKAQLGMPDMRLPIQYALAFPARLSSNFERLDFNKFSNLTFEEPDTRKFRNLTLAYEAIGKGGNMPCILNAANEIAVAAFLEDKISFPAMSEVIEKTMGQVPFIASPGLDDYMQTDAEARKVAQSSLRRQRINSK
ncbi:1-deoxy-D-xylulose 5-phosphate reductoisomerase [Bacteroidia bacterium]|nr:1-deoxy-D-xylulose 5-phosphate reductoisomerase [Bacteroidia bacterium]